MRKEGSEMRKETIHIVVPSRFTKENQVKNDLEKEREKGRKGGLGRPTVSCVGVCWG